jgi:hypothetical protein
MTCGSGSADPGVRIAINLLMACGSGSADPDVRIVIRFLKTTRGSGSTDPGVGIVQKFLLHVDARIRSVRILASTKF